MPARFQRKIESRSAAMATDPSANDSASGARRAGPVFFQRQELQRLLNLYGRMVAAGEWRDYSIEPGPEACAFSVFRRAAEAPLYRIEKRPALARRQGAWAVIGQGGMILRRGHELEQVLRVFEKGRFKVID